MRNRDGPGNFGKFCRISTEALGPGGPYFCDLLGEMRMAKVDMLGRGEQLFPQEFYDLTKVKLIMPIHSLRLIWCNWWGVFFSEEDKTRRCNFSSGLRLLTDRTLKLGCSKFEPFCETKFG